MRLPRVSFPDRLSPVIFMFWYFATSVPVALEARKSAGWPHCPGTVIESAVEVKSVGEDKRYAHTIRYSYDVGGVSREGRRFDSENKTHYSRDRAEAVAARYPAGSRVEVFYDPDCPERAVLVPGGIAGPYFGVGLSSVLLLMAAHWWWRGPRSVDSTAAEAAFG